MNDDLKNDLNDAMKHGRDAARSVLKAMRDAIDVAINAIDRDDDPSAAAEGSTQQRPPGAGSDAPPPARSDESA